VGERREEVEGDQFLSSPRAETVQGGRSTGGGGGELGRETEGWGPSWRGRAEGAARWIVSRAAVAEGGPEEARGEIGWASRGAREGASAVVQAERDRPIIFLLFELFSSRDCSTHPFQIVVSFSFVLSQRLPLTKFTKNINMYNIKFNTPSKYIS
jgi:hypothetical protein